MTATERRKATPNVIKTLAPHLNFDGRANEAIELYVRALGAEVLDKRTWGDMPGAGDKLPPEKRTNVMHARLRVGSALVFMNDAMPGGPAFPRTNGTQMVEIDDPSELARAFDVLSEGGEVVMALHDAFWGGKFGLLVDKLGVPWMFHGTGK